LVGFFRFTSWHKLKPANASDSLSQCDVLVLLVERWGSGHHIEKRGDGDHKEGFGRDESVVGVGED